MTAAYDSIPARVAKGAALLDEERPGWEGHIDVECLDLRSCALCILGQLFGDYGEGLDELEILCGRRYPNSGAIPYGFCAGGHEPAQIQAESLALAKEWAGLIGRRREAAGYGPTFSGLCETKGISHHDPPPAGTGR